MHHITLLTQTPQKYVICVKAIANMNLNHWSNSKYARLLQPWDNKILQWTWRRTVWNVWDRSIWLRVELSPGGGNRKSGVQSHSTLPMPSSAETLTQQAVWTRESASVPVCTPLCSSCSHCHVSNERPPGGALCQRYYLLLWQLVCLEKEAIKMSLTEK